MGDSHDRDLPPLGDGSMNLPYEPNPQPYETRLDGSVAGGLVVIAAAVQVDGIWRAALIFRFAIPDGSGFYPDMALIAGDDELKQVSTLAGNAAGDAIVEAHKRRRADGHAFVIALVRVTDRDAAGAGLPLKVAQALEAARAEGVALLVSPGAAMTVVDHDGHPATYPACLFGEPWMVTASRIVNHLNGAPA